MKNILLSIRPEWVCKILNGEKTIEIRKKFPKDYVGWVYIYCTKEKKYANLVNRGGFLTGMVVARFWCDKVEQIRTYTNCIYETNTLNTIDILKSSSLTHEQLKKYLGTNYDGSNDGYAIHISKVEIFDKPRELNEFKKCGEKVCVVKECHKYMHCLKPLTKAPQNYCYIEGD